VRVLLDECIDWRLTRYIVGHEVKTAQQKGWTTIKNGELLLLASQSFDVFVTVDRNLSFQQNLSGLPISVIALAAKTNRLADLVPRVPALLAAIESAKAGTATVISEMPG
jgi:predicted nuclease of predicted toxin-antitoxin system